MSSIVLFNLHSYKVMCSFQQMKYRTRFIMINNENTSLNWFSKYVVNTNDLLVNMDCFIFVIWNWPCCFRFWWPFMVSTNYLNSDILNLTFKCTLILIWHELFARNGASMRVHYAKIVCSIHHTFCPPRLLCRTSNSLFVI